MGRARRACGIVSTLPCRFRRPKTSCKNSDFPRQTPTDLCGKTDHNGYKVQRNVTKLQSRLTPGFVRQYPHLFSPSVPNNVSHQGGRIFKNHPDVRMGAAVSRCEIRQTHAAERRNENFRKTLLTMVSA